MIDVLFVSPSSMPLFQVEELLFDKNQLLVPKFETPTGLIELASYVRNNLDYVSFELLDLAKELNAYHRNLSGNLPTDYCGFVNRLLSQVETVPDVVGISILFSSSYLSSISLAKIIKEKWPKTKIIFGGGHVTFYHSKVFEDSVFVDYVFVGEAEIGFESFVKKLYYSQCNGGTDISVKDIKGVYDREKINNDLKGFIVNAEFGELLTDLDQIGLPAYDLLDLDYYRQFSNAFSKGAIGVMMDRGCPFKCTYCASMVIHGSGIRAKSNQRIIDDFLYLRDECGFTNVVLWDDLLAARKSKFTELARRILEEKVNKGLLFSMPSGLSVRIMDDKLLESVCSLGFDYVRIMIESGSSDAQKNIVKKKVDLDKARHLIAHARTLGVKVETNILFGFPYETKRHMQETIDYIKTIDVDWIQVFSLLPLPGTEAFDQYAKMGKLDPHNIDWDRCGYSSREFDTSEISAQELTDLVYDVNIYTNFFGNRNYLHGRYERAAKYFTDMVLWKYKFHIPALYMRAQSYLQLGDTDRATADLREAAIQIETNEISKSHWQRYGSDMPILMDYLDVGYHELCSSHPPSVDAGFVL